VLYGRGAECAALDRLLSAARDRQSSALVVRGEPGVGKSALLEHAAARADGMAVLRAVGIEAEVELPFAGLHQLLRPVLAHIASLPGPQSAALSAAVGLGAGEHDRFLVSAGVLSLLADVAESQPVLVIVDDSHWLDRASADALVFSARRLRAEGVVVLFGAREGVERRFSAGGVPELILTGLPPDAAGRLLDQLLPAATPADVRDHLVEVTGGNPLALSELPSALEQTHLTGREPLPDPLPVSDAVKRAFLQRVDRLPDDAQLLLLVAAAEDLGEADVIVRAAAAIGCTAGAFPAAEAAGLLRVDGTRVEFRHPLVRSAVYQNANTLQRRRVHAALADALSDPVNMDRKAWHQAAAANGLDEGAATALEQSAQRARARSGYAAAAAALDRAADLTPDVAPRARRLIAAATAAWSAGLLERVGALLDQAAPLVHDDRTSAEVEFLRGLRERADGTTGAAYDIFLRGAQTVASSDPQRAVAMLGAAGLAAWNRNDRDGLLHVAGRIRTLDFDDEGPGGLAARVVLGLASLAQDDAARAVSSIIGAMTSAASSGGPYELALVGAGASFIGDDAASLRLFGQAAARARTQGEVAVLVNLLAPYAAAEAWTGRIRSAMALATEGLELAQQTGHETYLAVYWAVLAWMRALSGEGDESRRLAAQAMQSGLEHEFSPTAATAAWALGLLALGAGRPDEALTQLNDLARREGLVGHPATALFATGDIVEAAVRAGDVDTARAATHALERWATGARPAWALGVAACCRALLSGDDGMDEHFREALHHHAHGTRPFEHGRTLLLYGEALRRRRRRMDARQHLRAALEIFERMGAVPWEQRARAELRASGETIRGRDPGTLDYLTPQELQIVQIVRTGATNKQIAAQLYLSPRTIDYHLRKVFVKLGLSSRTELIRLEADAPELDALRPS
jgi:DNA-binding CsgD family transcriptional regulator